MPVPTGSSVLDGLLRGGFPEGQPILLTGEPGTGKTTLAMQFLQAGLDAEEDCLFVSTEQSRADLEQSFEGFSFELDHANLDIATIHATRGKTLESDEEQLTLTTLSEEEEGLGGGFTAPFSGEYVEQYLNRFAPKDRVVLDSVSGLRTLVEASPHFRRVLMDIMRLFSDQFDATALLVGEEDSGWSTVGPTASDPIRYNAHGVIRVWREEVTGEHHPFLQVEKMRGVDHNSRPHLYEITARGLWILPRETKRNGSSDWGATRRTGIRGLDELLGGGLHRGGSAVLEHDARARHAPITTEVLSTALGDDWAVTFVPPMNATTEGLAGCVGLERDRVEELLDADRLFVVDPGGTFRRSHRNVFYLDRKVSEYPSVREAVRHLASAVRPGSADRAVKEVLSIHRSIRRRSADGPMLLVVNTGTLHSVLTADELRQLRHREQISVVDPEDVALYVHNPDLLSGNVATFYADTADQVLRTEIQQGIQFLQLRKSPHGQTDATRYVDTVSDPERVRIGSNLPRERSFD